MKPAFLICCCDGVPADAHQTPSVIASMIGDVNAEAARRGWAGTAFSRFSSAEGRLQFDVVPGEKPATIEDLRAFREAEKKRKEEEAAQLSAEPEQRSLLS